MISHLTLDLRTRKSFTRKSSGEDVAFGDLQNGRSQTSPTDATKDRERIADLIERARRSLHLTLSEIAASVQANEATLHRWRLGTSRPTAAYASRLESLDDLVAAVRRMQGSDAGATLWLDRADVMIQGRTPRALLLEGRSDYLLGLLTAASALTTGLPHHSPDTGHSTPVVAAGGASQLTEAALEFARATSVNETGAMLIRFGCNHLGAVAALVAVNADLVDGPLSVSISEPSELAIIASANVPPVAGVVWRRYPITLKAPIAEAARTGLVVAVTGRNELQERYPGGRPFFDERGLHAVCALPIATRTNVLGGASFFFSASRTFDAFDIAVMTSLAEHCATALDRIRLTRCMATDVAATVPAEERASVQ